MSENIIFNRINEKINDAIALKEILKEFQFDVNQDICKEIIARLYGYKSWDNVYQKFENLQKRYDSEKMDKMKFYEDQKIREIESNKQELEKDLKNLEKKYKEICI